MKLLSEKKYRQPTWLLARPIWLATFLIMIGCQSVSYDAATNSTEANSSSSMNEELDDHSLERNDDFKSFKDLFEQSTSLEEWPEKSQWSLVEKGEFYSNKSLNSVIEKNYTQISSEFYHLIPMDAVKRLDKYASEVKRPEKAFRWYAFQRIEKEGYTLTGQFAHKQNRNENDEYNAHPFLLVTYTASGKIIDQYVWWMIVDDDLQVWSDIAVHGDTFMVGHRPLPEEFAAPMDLVFKKVIVSPSGEFQVIYSQDPETMQE